MSILVTGGAGYIGSHAVLSLLDRGEEVVVLDDLSTGFDWCVAPGARLVRGDFGDGALLRRLMVEHRIEAIFHFAASLLVGESAERPLLYYDNNVARMLRLVQAAVEAGVPDFVFSSSAAVYGNTGAEPVTEGAPLQPVSPYGRTKAVGEMLLADAAAAHGFRYASLRYFNVAGADRALRTGESTLNSTHLVKIAVETALGKRQSLKIFGSDYPTPDGTAIRDYVHVVDLAEAHLAALDHLRGGAASLVANVGYGRGFSVREVVETVRAVTKLPLPAEDAPRRAGDPASIVADASLLSRLTGWRPRHDDLTEIVRDAFSWEQELSRRGHQ